MNNLLQTYQQLLLNGIVPFWRKFGVDRQYGGVLTCMAEDGRRISEEKRAIEQSMLRENAIRQAEEQNIEVSMSVEERKRLELQEHAINMAKEHPEDVAQLIRTWLREE